MSYGGGVSINLFRRLGRFINRHKKLVIVTWIIVFLLSIPMASMVLDAVDYTFATGGTEDLEAVEAQVYINENFGSSGSGNTGSIILIDSDPEHIFDQDIKSAIFNLTDRIEQGSIGRHLRVQCLRHKHLHRLVRLLCDLHHADGAPVRVGLEPIGRHPRLPLRRALGLLAVIQRHRGRPAHGVRCPRYLLRELVESRMPAAAPSWR